jgi:hypothetical protein
MRQLAIEYLGSWGTSMTETPNAPAKTIHTPEVNEASAGRNVVRFPHESRVTILGRFIGVRPEIVAPNRRPQSQGMNNTTHPRYSSVDEIGYVPISRRRHALFQLINRCYEPPRPCSRRTDPSRRSHLCERMTRRSASGKQWEVHALTVSHLKLALGTLIREALTLQGGSGVGP